MQSEQLLRMNKAKSDESSSVFDSFSYSFRGVCTSTDVV